MLDGHGHRLAQPDITGNNTIKPSRVIQVMTAIKGFKVPYVTSDPSTQQCYLTLLFKKE